VANNSNKCSSAEQIDTEFDDIKKNQDAYNQSIKEGFANPDELDGFEKFDQALTDFNNSVSNKVASAGVKIYELDKTTLNEKKVKKLLDKAMSYTESEKKEQAMMVTKLLSQIRHDSDFKAIAEDKILEQTKIIDFDGLRKNGYQINIDSITGLPNLYQIPLTSLRTIYNDLIPAMNVNEEGRVLGLMDNNIAFEWFLPKNVLRSAKKASILRFKNKLYKYPNEINRIVSSYESPIDIDVRAEKSLVHPGTDIPVINNLRRTQVGLTGILETFDASGYKRFKQSDMVGNTRQMYKLLGDLMLGKAFIRIDKEGYGKVYKFNNEVPKGRYDTGDTQFDWTGKDFTNEELESINQKNPKFTHRSYVEEYSFEGFKPIALNELAVSEEGYDYANTIDASLQAIDNIFKEIGLDMQDGFDKVQKRFDRIIKDFKSKNIEMPKEIFGELEKDIINIKDQANELNQQNQILRLREKTQFTDTYALKDGTEIIGRRFYRYFPRMYFNHNLGDALITALDKINRDLENLEVAIYPNPTPTKETEKRRYKSIERYQDLLKAKVHLQGALDRYRESDGQLYKDDDLPDVLRPFEKHFKALSHYIPFEYVRTDKQVYGDYVRRMTNNLVRSQLMLDMLEAYGDAPTKSFQNYVVNQYRKAFGSINSEGSFMGKRFDMNDLAKMVPGFDGDRLRKYVNTSRSLQTFNVLGGWLSGPSQLASMVNKYMSVGYDVAMEAWVDSQFEVNQKLMLKAGIMSFNDMIENHYLMQGNPDEIESYKKVQKKYKDKIARGDNVDLAKEVLRLVKRKNTAWANRARTLANYAISGEMKFTPDDNNLVKVGKLVLSLRKNLLPMTVTERIVRSTSFMIGVNQAINSGAAKDINDPVAVDWGVRFVQDLDFMLGAEGVGDMFGNDIMQWFNHMSVWRIQRMSWGKDVYKNAFMSKYAQTDLNRISKSSKASWEFIKALLVTMMGSGATIGGPLAGITAGATVGGVIGGGIGGAIGYATAKGMHSMSDFKERQRVLRLANPNLAGGAQMFLFHGLMSALYDFVLFNADLNFGTMGAIGQMLRTGKNFAFASQSYKAGTAFTSPLFRVGFAAAHLLYKALSDDDEVQSDDWVKMFGATFGIGAMQLVYGAMAILEDNNSLVKGSYDRNKDYERLFWNLNIPKILPGQMSDSRKLRESYQKNRQKLDRYGIRGFF